MPTPNRFAQQVEPPSNSYSHGKMHGHELLEALGKMTREKANNFLSEMSRSDLIAFCSWNDRNGIYRDSEVDGTPLQVCELVEIIENWIDDDRPVCDECRSNGPQASCDCRK